MRKTTPAEIVGLNTISTVRDILNGDSVPNTPDKILKCSDWLNYTWNLYAKHEVMMTENEYYTMCMSPTVDNHNYFYFALICSMRFQNTLKENERVLCRSLISRNPMHTNMINNIQQQMYYGDVICYIGPYINEIEADHAADLAKSRKIDGKILIMTHIAKIENKLLTWVMLPSNLFSNLNVGTLFLPDTIDDFAHCRDSAQSSASMSE